MFYEECNLSDIKINLIVSCVIWKNNVLIVSSPYQALHCKNMQKARELWDTIMTKGNAKYANMWLEYYNLERSVNPCLMPV